MNKVNSEEKIDLTHRFITFCLITQIQEQIDKEIIN